jgi:hypothetical protein
MIPPSKLHSAIASCSTSGYHETLQPHMSASFDQAQVIQTTQTESQEDMGMLPGTESRADLLFKSADGTKVILVDVTSTSGISKHAKLQYTPGAVAGMAELRKAASYSRLIFFGIELSGCLGPEAQHICKQMAGVGGEGPEGLKNIYESLSIGFQVNRASESSILSSVVCLVVSV